MQMDIRQAICAPVIPSQILNKYNVNVVIFQQLKWTVAHVIAIRGASHQFIDELVAHGAKLQERDCAGWTPIQLSTKIHGFNIFEKNQDCIPRMIKHGKTTDAHVAAIRGRLQDVMKVIDMGVDMKQSDCFGFSPLDYLELLHGDGAYYQEILNIRDELSFH